MALQLSGIHHLTAITAQARENLKFYTDVMGMRLIKRTVNQDDTSAYHLFYGDGVASPGADLTFFDWPVGREGRGTHSIVRTGLRVRSEDDLAWWKEHLKAKGIASGNIKELYGFKALEFEDPEGQRFRLVADPAAGASHPWEKSPVPAERQILGLGPVTISVPRLDRTAHVLTEVLSMREVRVHPAREKTGEVHVFAMGEGGAAAELHVAVEPELGFARQGAGGAHHVAFRTENVDTLHQWINRVTAAGLRSSGEVERFYFTSLYFREPNGVLFEIATDGPGFAVDEPLATLGESLSLPPFLEPDRAAIEAKLKPID